MPVTALQAAFDVLDRAESLLKIDPGKKLVKLVHYDVRRQSVAMAVAALDTWMHWSIRNAKLNSLSKSLAELEISFGDLVASGKYSVASRKAGINDRPDVRARNTLNEKLLTMTFQNARQWETGLGMLGVKKGLTKAAAAMTPPESHKDVSDRLNRLSHRRNKIVHEGDLLRQLRPGRVRRESLLRSDVDDDIAWIRRFLTAVDSIC